MTTHTATIVNGQATIQIDTTGMNEGAYDVETSYAQNNKYTNANTSSILTLTSGTTTITDNCTTTTNWQSTDSRPAPTITTISGTTSVTPCTGLAGKSYWKYPIVRGTQTSLEFKVYLNGSATTVIQLVGLNREDNNNDTYPLTQYVNVWGRWGGNVTGNFGSSLSTGAWHTIRFEINDNAYKISVDGTSLKTGTIGTVHTNPYFNNYFFLALGHETMNVYVRDVVYTTDSLVSDSVLDAIRSAHLAQF